METLTETPPLGLVGGQLVRKPRPLDVGNGITTGLPFESFKFQILTWCCVGKSDCCFCGNANIYLISLFVLISTHSSKEKENSRDLK